MLFGSGLERILDYRADPSQLLPSVQDYRESNVTGVNRKNLAEVNERVAYLNQHPESKIYPYSYDTTRDYLYDFNHTISKRDIVQVVNNRIDLKDIDIDEESTVLLKIRVETTATGEYFEPEISARSDGKTCTHTFEPRAKGIRYLNLSSLELRRGQTIELKGKYLGIPDQSSELILFKNSDLGKKRILVIAPHPDDAEIAAYGLYSRYHDNVYIVTITAGEAGPHRYYDRLFSSRKEQYLEKGRVRTFDSLTVSLLGNVPFEHNINLGFFDGTLKKMYQDKARDVKGLYTDTSDISTFRKQNGSPLAKGLTGGSNWNALVTNLAYLIKTIRPEIIVTPYSALDWHTDHKYSTAAVTEALMQLRIKKGQLFLYTNHLPASEYYPFGKEGQPVTLPPEYVKTLYFDRIYSHQVSRKDQGRKAIALDKMSDIMLDKKWSHFWNICEGRIPFVCQDLSYIRRAVRSNELFFVVDIKNIYNRKILETILN